MTNENNRSIKLGAFVLTGMILLLGGLYLIGTQRDLFSRTLTVLARFTEVGGLRTGDNVRYAGIDVGTVKEVRILSDTVVVVAMLVRTEDARHIRTDALARISSDGLMGSKLVCLEAGNGTGTPIVEGTELRSLQGLDTDDMLRTLGRSNDNLMAITNDLRTLTHGLNAPGGLADLFQDSLLVQDLRMAVTNAARTAAHARALAARVDHLAMDLQAGRGALGAVLSDTTTERQVRNLLAALQQASAELERFTDGLQQPGGLGHLLVGDTVIAQELRRVTANLDTGSATLREDLRALQRNWFFRRYFKEKEKQGH
ncbi:MAG TPA: MlaD family protein [Flavobacteriales bacterium]